MSSVSHVQDVITRRPLYLALSGSRSIRNTRSCVRGGARGVFGYRPSGYRDCPHCGKHDGLTIPHLLRECNDKDFSAWRMATTCEIFDEAPVTIKPEGLRYGCLPDPRFWSDDPDVSLWWYRLAVGGPMPEVRFRRVSGQMTSDIPRIWTTKFPRWQYANERQRDQLKARAWVLKRTGSFLVQALERTRQCLPAVPSAARREA